MNGDPNIDEMGDISNVTVFLLGNLQGANDVTVRVCRNAGEATRTYTSVTLTRTDNYNGSTLSKWEGTIDLSADGAVQKSRLGVEFTVPGTAGDSTGTQIVYSKFSCDTVSDTRLSNGTIEAYSNPVVFTDGGQDWVDTNLQGFNRLEAAERLRELTESDEVVNELPHWDAHIDQAEAFHFQERRGTDHTNLEYTVELGNLDDIEHEYYGDELAFQTIAYGAGSGIAQSRIVSKEEFSTGGLYDADRDPGGGTRLYGDLPRGMQFIDANEVSATNLLRKARAAHKLWRDPQESWRVGMPAEYVAYFETGDGLPLKNPETRTDDTLRVAKLDREWTPRRGEDLKVLFGSVTADSVERLRGTNDNTRVLSIRASPAKGDLGLAGNGIYFDATHFGVYSFNIPDGSLVDRVFLKVETLPWQATARGAAGGAGATSGSSGHTLTLDSSPSLGPTAVASEATNNFDFTITTWGTSEYQIAVTIDPNNTQSLTGVKIEAVGVSQGVFEEIQAMMGAGYVVVFRTPATISGETLRVAVTNLGVTSTDYTVTVNFYTVGSHTHTVPAHTHPFDFGIYQFDGDTGDGTGDPIYGELIEMAVDPTVSGTTGLPTNFANERIPQRFGKNTLPASLEADVTGWMAVDAEGVIKSGQHKVFLQSNAGTNNAEGLAVTSITPILKFKTVEA